MQTSELERVEDSELGRVMRWRAEELQRAGYDQQASVELAMRFDVDLHLAVDLLRDGCSRHTALEILL